MTELVICSRCVYDANTPSISFDAEGVCNYCRTMERMEEEYPLGAEGERRLERMADAIRASGRGKRYDCVVGVSGGCDSSYLLYRVKEMGLRPLAAHFDNTWNSRIATENIHHLLEALGVDLYTYVVDNKEYDDLYRAFMRSGVSDLDIQTDIGLATTLYMAAEKHGIKYVIEGHSFRTEGISPLGWSYMDARYIASIQKAHGTRELKTFPNLWLSSFLKWTLVRRIRKVRPLYYMDYHKEDAKRLLSSRFGWQWYGGHHLENRFTAFVHTYFFPRRFGIDQRANGYAALARSGQITRDQALARMRETPTYDVEIVELVKKRLGFSDAEFEAVMNLPRKTFRDYATYKRTFERLRPLIWYMYRNELVTKSFYMKYTAPYLARPPELPGIEPVPQRAPAGELVPA